MRPLFGDFLARAHDGIAAAVSILGELPSEARPGVICELDRLVTTLARYAGDAPLPGEADPLPGGPHSGSSVREARIALRRSAQVLHYAVGATTTGISTGEVCLVTRNLADAATQLAAGRDLLHTHFSTDPATGARNRASAWAKAIYAPSVTEALLSEIASMAARLAPWMMRLSLESPPGPAMPATAGLALHEASTWLWTAGLKLEACSRHQQPSADARHMLATIPANLPPAHRPVTPTETLQGLCEGVIITAGRLQHAAASFARMARWSPQATSVTWRRDALAAAITSHSSQVITGNLALRVGALGLDPIIEAHLDNTLRALKTVTQAWRAVVAEWRVLSTGIDRGKGVSPVAAEIDDLVLRIGRLAYDNREWTPAGDRVRPPRPPAALAPTPNDLRTMLAAVHHAIDTLAHIAATDRRCVRRAAADSRLYIPTRLLPADNDIPYSHVPAPRSRVTALLDGYNLAVKTCTAATEAFDGLALAAGAASRDLAAAHASPTCTPPPPAAQPWEPPFDPSAVGVHTSPLAASLTRPGHLESAVRELQLTEPALLTRAGAIDQAARNLLAEATAKATRQAAAYASAPVSPGNARSPTRRRPTRS